MGWSTERGSGEQPTLRPPDAPPTRRSAHPPHRLMTAAAEGSGGCCGCSGAVGSYGFACSERDSAGSASAARALRRRRLYCSKDSGPLPPSLWKDAVCCSAWARHGERTGVEQWESSALRVCCLRAGECALPRASRRATPRHAALHSASHLHEIFVLEGPSLAEPLPTKEHVVLRRREERRHRGTRWAFKCVRRGRC